MDSATDVPRPASSAKRWWVIVSLMVVLGLVGVIRIRLLDFPLERDEGEYAYAGQLMLDGIPPYQHVYNMKWPGIYAAYAAMMGLCGQSTTAIHACLLVITLATALVLFFLARPICGEAASVVAAGTYALLSISPPTLGLAAHATHFVILPALAGVLLLRDLDERTSLRRVLAVGLLIGLSTLMKQAGAAFGVFAALWVLWFEARQTPKHWTRLSLRLGVLAAGGLFPILVTCGILAWAGVFDRFWLWTIHYARAYVSIVSPAQGMQMLAMTARQLWSGAPALWGLALAGLPLLFVESSVRRAWFFVLGLALFSFLAVCPGWYFRGHYFLLFLPAIGLLAGVAVQAAGRLLARLKIPLLPVLLPAAVFLFAAWQSLDRARDIFFQLTPEQACRLVYGANPFPESVEIASYIASHCPPESRIAVVGSEPQIYFYSHRRSATGYIYTYPLMEPQPYATAMQEEMIREIEAADPAYLVFVNVSTSWLQRPTSNPLILNWLAQYRKRFDMEGLVEILPDRTDYRWKPTGSQLVPKAKSWVAIFRNKKFATK